MLHPAASEHLHRSLICTKLEAFSSSLIFWTSNGPISQKDWGVFSLLLVQSPGGSSLPRTIAWTVGPVGPKNMHPPWAAAVKTSIPDVNY